MRRRPSWLRKEEIHLALDASIADRTDKLSKVYHSIALRFCELHDTPGRMLEKKVIQKVVPWKSSRQFFGKRLLRRVLEVRLQKQHVNLYDGFKGDQQNDDAAIEHLQTWSDSNSFVGSEVEAVSALLNRGDDQALAALLGGLSDEAKKTLLSKLK